MILGTEKFKILLIVSKHAFRIFQV